MNSLLIHSNFSLLLALLCNPYAAIFTDNNCCEHVSTIKISSHMSTFKQQVLWDYAMYVLRAVRDLPFVTDRGIPRTWWENHNDAKNEEDEHLHRQNAPNKWNLLSHLCCVYLRAIVVAVAMAAMMTMTMIMKWAREAHLHAHKQKQRVNDWQNNEPLNFNVKQKRERERTKCTHNSK